MNCANDDHHPCDRRGFVGVFAIVLALLASGFSGAAVAAPNDGIGFDLVADGFSRPVQVVDPSDDSSRLFVVEQTGTIRIVRDGEVTSEPFLDISGQLSQGNEQGLLSMAFHPKFAENGTFFIDYTDQNGDTHVEQWAVSGDDPDVADPDSAETILEQTQPYPNHNGGLLLFGPDGFLYIGLGDGGSQGDPDSNGQNPNTWLGSILRIDVDKSGDDLPYAIPNDNPFADGDGGAPEVWVYGLRNPWRFSFDRETGDLYIGDVGQDSYEEVSRFQSGSDERNFGWNVMEGFSCYQESDCDQSGLMPPIFDYSHDVGGCSVVGGYVYRGNEIDDLQGIYLFADYCSGLLWQLEQGDDGTWTGSRPISTGLNISSFGEDASGELYVVDLNGGVYRIVAGS